MTTPARHGAKVPQPPAANGPKVTFNYRDRAGAATTAAGTFVFGIDVDVLTTVVPGSDGTATVTLPPGRYLLESTVDTPRAGTDIPSTSVLVNPELAVSTDTTVTVDATEARQVSVTVPDRRAMALNTSVNYWRLLDRGPVSSSIGSPDPTALFSAHTGPTVPGEQFATAVSAYFARPGPDGTATNSPLVYAAAWKHHNRFPTGFRKHVREADLSTVRAEHAAASPRPARDQTHPVRTAALRPVRLLDRLHRSPASSATPAHCAGPTPSTSTPRPRTAWTCPPQTRNQPPTARATVCRTLAHHPVLGGPAGTTHRGRAARRRRLVR